MMKMKMLLLSMSENVYMALMHYTEFGYSPIDIKLVKRAKRFFILKKFISF